MKVVSEKRERIIQAATIIFARQGFYNSTVADVAKEASVADGTIYLYFKNKDDLLISIFERSMDMFIQAAEEEINKEKSAENQLKRFIDLHLRLVHKHQELAQVIQIELRQSSKFIKEYANEKFFSYLNIVEKIIQRGKEQKIFNVDINAGILKSFTPLKSFQVCNKGFLQRLTCVRGSIGSLRCCFSGVRFPPVSHRRWCRKPLQLVCWFSSRTSPLSA